MGIRERKVREFERREREILGAARDLFTTDDWQAVTVEQIADRAEVGKGTVYKHFAGKDDIYACLAAEFHRTALERLEAIDASAPVLKRLRSIIEVVWEQYRAGEQYQNLVQYCERSDFRNCLSAERQAELEELDTRRRAVIDRVLRDGIEQGILPRKPLEALVFGPTAALQGAVRHAWLTRASEREQREYLTEITNFILAGMLYQEWLADEGLDEDEARRRAEAELEAARAPQ